MSTRTLPALSTARPSRRSGRATLIGVTAVMAVAAAGIMFAPRWVTILTLFALALIGSVWVTRPPEVSLGRHVGALIAEAFLEVIRTALKAVIYVVVVLGLLVAAWSWAGPRIATQVGQWRDQTITAVTPSIDLPKMPWETK